MSNSFENVANFVCPTPQKLPSRLR